MSKKILILAPRLDCMFKKGAVPATIGPTPPVRIPWENFVKHTEMEHRNRGDNVKVVTLPLWQFSPETVEMYNADLTYVPHKEKHNFPCPKHNVLYYMQMVFPYLFMVDPKGWCGGANNWPIQPQGDPEDPRVGLLCQRAWNNTSKFEQPAHQPISTFPRKYIFFPCQIPHDETIKHHSNIDVPRALRLTCEFAKNRQIPLMVKGHPVNPGSMEPLKKYVQKLNNPSIRWVEDVSVHDLLRTCEAVFTVNSGVGMEALLHNKPVFTFGDADYSSVTNSVRTVNQIEKLWNQREQHVPKYRHFLASYLDTCFNTNDVKDFVKLPK